MTAKGIKYPGKLGKPYRIPESEVMAVLLADSGETPTTKIEKLEKRKEMELLLELLDHYEISRDDESRWFHLTRRLAIAHVPAFRDPGRRPGRPKKERHFDGLSLAEIQRRTEGLPGRERKWTEGRYRELLELVKSICADQGFDGRGAVTKALDWYIRRVRKPETRTKDLNYLRKRYSEAKKKFPELAR